MSKMNSVQIIKLIGVCLQNLVHEDLPLFRPQITDLSTFNID